MFIISLENAEFPHNSRNRYFWLRVFLENMITVIITVIGPHIEANLNGFYPLYRTNNPRGTLPYSVQCTLYSVRCTGHSVHRPLPTVLRTLNFPNNYSFRRPVRLSRHCGLEGCDLQLFQRKLIN